MSTPAAPVAVVVGVGPGFGEALARRFHAEGWRVALMARNEGKLQPLAEELGGIAVACDATDPDSVIAAFAAVRAQLGPVHTLLWNVGSGVWGDIDKIDVAGMQLAWGTNVLGLFVAAQQVVGDMRGLGAGNIIVTGATATRRGKPFTTAFAAGKAAQRSLCESLARKLGSEGIHVALVVVDGRVLPPDQVQPGQINPVEAVDTWVHLARQKRSAWTFELEIRPSTEDW